MGTDFTLQRQPCDILHATKTCTRRPSVCYLQCVFRLGNASHILKVGGWDESWEVRTLPHFEAGDQVQCWLPAVDPVPDGYRCGDRSCARIEQPGRAVEYWKAESRRLEDPGQTTLVIS